MAQITARPPPPATPLPVDLGHLQESEGTSWQAAQLAPARDPSPGATAFHGRTGRFPSPIAAPHPIPTRTPNDLQTASGRQANLPDS